MVRKAHRRARRQQDHRPIARDHQICPRETGRAARLHAGRCACAARSAAPHRERPRALDDAQAALDYLANAADDKDHRGESVTFDAAKVKIHAPRPNGTRLACAGSNFQSHRERMTRRSRTRSGGALHLGLLESERAALGPDSNVTYPARCDRLDYEGEAAIVIGKNGRDLKPGALKDYVWGVTLFCDWSIRSPREPLGPMNFAIPKNWDGSGSLGPCIVVREADCTNIDIETFVNARPE